MESFVEAQHLVDKGVAFFSLNKPVVLLRSQGKPRLLY